MQILDVITKKLKYVSTANPVPTVHSARSAAAVTTNDGADLTGGVSKYIYVGVTGDVKVDMSDGSTVVFKALPVGLYPLAVKKIYATGTTATNILAIR